MTTYYVNVEFRRWTDPGQTGGMLNENEWIEQYDVTDIINEFVKNKLRCQKEDKNITENSFLRQRVNNWRITTEVKPNNIPYPE
jgi:hypothetical protein